jgi:hypothetical protein
MAEAMMCIGKTRSPFLLLIAAVAAMAPGCSSTTTVISQPSRAEVILDGQSRLGETPLEIRDLAWVWRKRELQVRKDGYYTSIVNLESEYQGSSVALCICSLGLLWPILFVGEYPSQILIELEPIERAETIDFSAPTAVQFP